MFEKESANLRHYAIVFAIALMTFAVTLNYGYTWDDPFLFNRVRQALSSGDISSLFTSGFYVKQAGSARYFRPVMFATLAGEVSLTGGISWFSHMVNILIHALNSVLVYVFLRKRFGNPGASLFGALLFAVYPVHAEAVAAVSNRMDLLALTLLMPAAIIWVSFDADPASVSKGSRAAALLCFFLACLTKETAIMLPLVFIVWTAVFRRPLGKPERIYLLHLILTVCIIILIRWIVFSGGDVTEKVTALKAGSLLPLESISRIGKIILINMRMAVWPFPVRTLWAGSDLIVGWVTLLGAGLFIAAAVWAIIKSPKYSGEGLLWWVVFSLPVLGFINLGQVVAAERYAYIPSVGLSVIAGGIAATWSGHAHAKIKNFALAVIIILAASAAWHTKDFRNEITLFRKVARHNPDFPTVHLNLGAALAKDGRFEEALESYNRASALAPAWTDPLFNRGNLRYRTGKYKEAIVDFRSVLENDPEDWEAELNLGNSYAALGEKKKAAAAYQRASHLNSSSGKPLVALGVLAGREADFDKAAALFREATLHEPDLAEAYQGMGDSYIALGRLDLAEAAFLKTLEISPESAQAAAELGKLYTMTNRHVQASFAYRAALAADPSLQRAWEGLIISLDASGESQQADQLILELDRMDSDLADRIRKIRGK
jgi:Flp pilus assembly protein TadD